MPRGVLSVVVVLAIASIYSQSGSLGKFNAAGSHDSAATADQAKNAAQGTAGATAGASVEYCKPPFSCLPRNDLGPWIASCDFACIDQQMFTVRADGLHRLIPDGTEAGADWEQLRDAAVASGAFPFAFRPLGIDRSKTEFVNRETPLYPGPIHATTEGMTYVQWGPNEPCAFAYADGGALQNQPLGIAKGLGRYVSPGPIANCETASGP